MITPFIGSSGTEESDNADDDYDNDNANSPAASGCDLLSLCIEQFAQDWLFAKILLRMSSSSSSHLLRLVPL
jgi:hypothetical protein